MSIRFYKSYTPSTRGRALSGFSEITKSKPERSLIRTNHRKKGRNNRGVITIRHRGGGHKKRYREIDFQRKKYSVEAIIKSIEYDPNRNARIALVHYQDGEKRYILHPNTIKVGDKIISGYGVPLNIGNTLPLDEIPLGTSIHNIELIPKKGVYLVKSLIDTQLVYGMMNIGINPTVSDSEEVSIEVFLFNFNQSLYGQELTVQLLDRIRDEIKFPGLQELKLQLESDRQAALDKIELLTKN